MTFDIRDMTQGSVASLIELFEIVLPRAFDDSGLDPDGSAKFLRDPASFAFGAYVDGEPAGLAWGIQMPYPNGRKMTYLHELDVLEQHRRQHIGSALVETSMELARSLGSTRFWLSTGGHNTIAQAVYESLGGGRKPLGDVNYWWDL